MPFTELAPSDCPLLAGRPEAASLLDAHRKVTSQFRLIEERMPDALRQEPFPQLLGRLRAAEMLLRRTHYRVGCIGTTQAGKSTIVNRVLDVRPEENAPAKSGSGASTTSTVMRLTRAAPGERSVRLRYLSSAEYKTKRDHLCQATGFGLTVSDTDILRLLPDRRREVAAGKGGEPADGVMLERDFDFLEDLLVSYQKFGEGLLADPPKAVGNVRYDDRSKYLNHGPDAHPTAPLLREVHIAFDSANLPDGVELLDLPGLGSSASVDTILSRNFLQELDGVFLFIRSEQLDDSNAEELLARLRKLFEGEAVGRIWVVYTKFDTLIRPQLDGDPTVFDGIARFCARTGIPAEQVCLTSADWHRETAENIQQHFRKRLQAEDSVPPKLAEHQRLRPAFDRLLDGGGIPALRELMTRKVRGAVAAQIERAADRQLTDLRKDVAHQLELKVRQSLASQEETNDARACKTEALRIRVDVRRETEPLENCAKALRADLWQFFQRLFPEAQVLDEEFDGIRKAFRGNAPALEQKLHDLIGAVALPQLYDRWRPRLEKMPRIPVLACSDGPGEAWREFDRQDCEDLGWRRGRLPTFLSDDLFAGGPEVSPFRSGAEFWAMMAEKTELTAEQTAYALQGRLVERLELLVEELGRLAESAAGRPADSAGRFALNELLAQVKEFAR